MARLRFSLVIPLAFLLRSTAWAAEAPVEQPDAHQLQQGFFFDWTTAGTPIPVVEQCDTLDITWARGAAKGSNPTSPYTLQIYTSTFVTPLIVSAGSGQEFKFPVPFVPDTQFQICMFDKNGVTGGCQRTMTVIPSSLSNSPTCTNLTYPRLDQALAVTALDTTGPASQYGWPSQCTDLSLTPTNGTPPYTLTVAPSLHPPYNYTLNSTGTPINWTIALSWGSPFFVSLADAVGNAWAWGPMHSGEGLTNECLNPTQQQPEKKDDNSISMYVAVGAGVGGAVGGLLLGLLAAFCMYRRSGGSERVSRGRSRDSVLTHEPMTAETPYAGLPTVPSQFGGYHAHTDSNASQTPYKVEPWVPAGTPSASSRYGGHTQSTQGTSPPPVAASADSAGRQQSSGGQGSHVYVVHHDGGRAPVSVYTDNGTEVVELPPMYANEGTAAQSGTRRRPSMFQRRLPNAPRKPELRTENPNEGPASVGSPTSPQHTDLPHDQPPA